MRPAFTRKDSVMGLQTITIGEREFLEFSFPVLPLNQEDFDRLIDIMREVKGKYDGSEKKWRIATDQEDYLRGLLCSFPIDVVPQRQRPDQRDRGVYQTFCV